MNPYHDTTWREFWGAFENFQEKNKWRISCYTTPEQERLVDIWFYEAADRLRIELERFCKLKKKSWMMSKIHSSEKVDI